MDVVALLCDFTMKKKQEEARNRFTLDFTVLTNPLPTQAEEDEHGFTHLQGTLGNGSLQALDYILHRQTHPKPEHRDGVPREVSAGPLVAPAPVVQRMMMRSWKPPRTAKALMVP